MTSRSEIGRDIRWIDVVGHVFRVLEFDRTGTTIGLQDRVKAKTWFRPYGYLLVESPIFSNPTRLPIVHRDDFGLASTVFDEPHLAKLVIEEELLVTYLPKEHLPTGHALGTSHVLHYVLVPRGTLHEYYSGGHTSPSTAEHLFVNYAYEGEIKVQVNRQPFPEQQRPEGIH